VSRALAALLVGLLFALPAAGSTSSARILFDEPHGSSFDLVEIDADATNYLDGPNGVQNTSAEIFDSDPVWSPDGNEIAYVKKVGQAENVWLMRPDGAAQRQVTSDGGEKASLSWQPKGARLVYVEDGGVFTLLEGDSPVRIATGGEPVWSPDDSTIAFVGTQYSPFPPSGSAPTWWPEGPRLLFESQRTTSELATTYVMNADGTCDQVGTYGEDVLVGTPRRDRLCALPGADRVYGAGGNDYLGSDPFGVRPWRAPAPRRRAGTSRRCGRSGGGSRGRARPASSCGSASCPRR
jgi:hypothetical protein